MALSQSAFGIYKCYIYKIVYEEYLTYGFKIILQIEKRLLNTIKPDPTRW